MALATVAHRLLRRRPIWIVMTAAAVLVPMATSGSAAAAPKDPVVLAAKAVPGAMPAGGGTVTVVGKVSNAATCRVAVLGDHGVKVTGPKPAGCGGGSYSEPVTFGPNPGRSPVVVKLGLLAGPARGVFYVVVAGSQAGPEVLSARATPWELPAKGGWTTVTGMVRNATTCHLNALAWKRPVLPSQRCSAGTFSEKLWLSPNPKHVPEPLPFELVVTGKGKPAVGKFFVRLAPAPVPPPTTTTTVPTSTPPVTNAVTSSAPPPAFFPPPPPYVPPETTTTTVPPTTTTVAPTTTTTTARTTTTTTAPTTTTTTTVPPPTLVQLSNNWSGYAVQGKTEALTATAVTGTFTVPQLTYAASCNDVMSIWNGIDGEGGTSGANYLIQAGVALQTRVPYGSNAGTCAPSGQFYIVPWWEVITPANVAPETFIETWDDGNPTASGTTAISAGDQVTVTIDEVSSGQWNIILSDYNPNTGVTETFNYLDYYGSYVSYAGPGASAEWIVEDTDQPDNPNCTWPGNGLYLCPMPAYDPSVQFTSSGFNSAGVYGQTDQISMTDQSGNVVSAPSSIGTNGDFSVTYVGNGTNAPNGAVRVRTLGSRAPSVVKSSPPSLSPQPHLAAR
jgi:hypothetical protein